MDNPDKQATQDTERRQTTQWTIQMNWKHKTHDEDKHNNGQSRYTGNTRHRTKTNKIMDNPDKLATQDTGRRPTKQWTIQINWQHKTQDEDQQNNGQSR